MAKQEFESASEVEKKIKKKDQDFRDLFYRMDYDYEMWALRKREPTVDYSQQDVAFKTAEERPFEVDFVSPSPRSYADHIQSRLADSERQIIVRMLEKEEEDKRDDVAKFERLMAFALEKADERLTSNPAMGIPLLDFIIWSAMIRGRLAARILVLEDDGDVMFDFTGLDPRFLRYDVGGRGMMWTAYETTRSASAIKDEYGKDAKDENNNLVTDYWRFVKPGEMVNGVLCDGKWLQEPEPHKLKSFPILYLPVANVPPISSITSTSPKVSVFEGTVKGEFGQSSRHGDSIYAPVREIYQFENDIISMWASHAKLLYAQPTINYYDDEGKPLTTTAFMSEAVINLPLNHNKLEPSPLKEISPTLVNLAGLVSGLRQRATLPDIEFGELRNFPLSGTAINELQQARNKVFGPLIRSLNIFYTNICRSIEEQMIEGGLSVTVKSEIDRKYYEKKVTSVDLKQPHIIRVEFTSQTPWTQLDTYQIADMAKRQGLPDEFIWENILKLPDPKGLTDMSAVEIAEHSPTLMKLNAIKTLMKQGRQDEANTLIQEMFTDFLQQQLAQGKLQAGETAPQEEGRVPV